MFAALWIVLPSETIVDESGNVDWFGAFLGLSALVLFNFVWKYVALLLSEGRRLTQC